MLPSNSKINLSQTTTTTTTSVDHPTTRMEKRWETSPLNPSSASNQNDPGFSDTHNLIRDLLNTIYKFLGHEAILNFIEGGSLDDICKPKPYVLKILLENQKYDTLLQPTSWTFVKTDSKELNDKVAAQLKDLCKFDKWFNKAYARKAKVELLVSEFYKYENQDRLVLSNHTFCKLTLENEDFSGIEFNNCTFYKCYFFGIKFNSSFIVNTTFNKCVISNCEFMHANFQSTTITECKLDVCDFSNADLTTVTFINFIMNKRIFFESSKWQYDNFAKTLLENNSQKFTWKNIENCTIYVSEKGLTWVRFKDFYFYTSYVNLIVASIIISSSDIKDIRPYMFQYCEKNKINLVYEQTNKEAITIDMSTNDISLENFTKFAAKNVRFNKAKVNIEANTVIKIDDYMLILSSNSQIKVIANSQYKTMLVKIDLDSIIAYYIKDQMHDANKIKEVIRSIYNDKLKVVDANKIIIESQQHALAIIYSKIPYKTSLPCDILNDMIFYGYEVKEAEINASDGHFTWESFKTAINNKYTIVGNRITIDNIADQKKLNDLIKYTYVVKKPEMTYKDIEKRIYNKYTTSTNGESVTLGQYATRIEKICYSRPINYSEFHAYTSCGSYNFSFKNTNILLDSVVIFVITKLCSGDLLVNGESCFSTLPKDLMLEIANNLICSIINDIYDKSIKITDSNGFSKDQEQSFKFISEWTEKYIDNKLTQQDNDLNVAS